MSAYAPVRRSSWLLLLALAVGAAGCYAGMALEEWSLARRGVICVDVFDVP